MTVSASPSDVRLNSGTGRFELAVGDETAYINYRVLTQGEVGFIHTEVPQALEGQGIGSALVEGALDIVRERTWTVLPYCPFVHGWMKRNPGYADLVSYRYPKRAELLPEPQVEEEEEEAEGPPGDEASHGQGAGEEDESGESRGGRQ